MWIWQMDLHRAFLGDLAQSDQGRGTDQEIPEEGSSDPWNPVELPQGKVGTLKYNNRNKEAWPWPEKAKGERSF